ncbi:MAG: zinc-ribbon domain-containing protein [Candidatus Moranbacteria bacterium]|nr:zinc-ribbon domain-containing protein [Candidatus Moranbacteria bacterium]
MDRPLSILQETDMEIRALTEEGVPLLEMAQLLGASDFVYENERGMKTFCVREFREYLKTFDSSGRSAQYDAALHSVSWSDTKSGARASKKRFVKRKRTKSADAKPRVKKERKTKPKPEPKPKPKPKPVQKKEKKPKSAPEPRVKPEPKPKPEPRPKKKPGRKPKPVSKPKLRPKIKPRPRPKPRSKLKLKLKLAKQKLRAAGLSVKDGDDLKTLSKRVASAQYKQKLKEGRKPKVNATPVSATLQECNECRYQWPLKDKTKCPACAFRVVTSTNNLAAKYPKLAAEYSEKNEKQATEVCPHPSKRFWWKCRTCEYEWESLGVTRFDGGGCPACSHRVLTPTNNLSFTHPALASEYARRNTKHVWEVFAGTTRLLWWKCPVKSCGHEYRATGHNRLAGRGCPECARNTKGRRKKEANA